MIIMTYFDLELKMTVLYAFLGIVIGYASFMIVNPSSALGVALGVLLATYYVINKKINKDAKWWMGNGAVVYLFLWLLSWSIFNTMNFYSTLA